MTMRGRLRSSLVVFMAAATLAAFTTPDWQVREGGAAAGASGTAVLSGVVVTDTSTPQPARRATVRLSGDAIPSTRVVGTDDDGRFRFEALPAGRYTLAAVKAGHVETFYGSRRPGRGPGVPVAVGDGAAVNVTLRLLPGAVITGVITDPNGSPAPGIAVAAVEVRATGAAAAPVQSVTDDRGVYRIFGLAPGEYLVSAIPRVTPAGGRGLSSNGAVIGVTDADVRRARGAGATAMTSMAETPAPPGPLVAYAPIYFPGTTDASAATLVPAASGETQNVAMSLRIVPMARIRGTLIDGGGQPVDPATVSLFPRRGDRPSPIDALVSSRALVLPRATVTAEGFTIAGVAPGEYTLVARSGSGQRGAAPPPADGPGPLWSVLDVSVDGSDRRDLVLRMLPGIALTGAIAFDRTTLTPPADLGSTDMLLIASNPLLGAASTARAVVNPDGSFRFRSIAPGSYMLQASPPAAATGARWSLKSALIDGRDLADRPLHVGSGGDDLTGLAVTFTDRAAEISGRLIDTSNQPVTRYAIVVVTTERSFWLANARRIRSVQPATDGSFTVAGLPAGEYGIAAVEEIDAADLADPAFLSRLLESAFRVTLADGERKRQDMRVGG